MYYVTEKKCFHECKGTKGKTENIELGRYELYVVSPQLREGLGVALIDSGIKDSKWY
jgi:hypothetical protein